jgi:hypothetical protein
MHDARVLTTLAKGAPISTSIAGSISILAALACATSLVACAADDLADTERSSAALRHRSHWQLRHRDAGADSSASDAAAIGDGRAPGADASTGGDAEAPAATPSIDCLVTTCHYVRSGATGASDGSSWTDAYPSLPATLIRGDAYFVASGSYGRTDLRTPTSGSALIVVKKATVNDHGTDVGWLDAMGVGQAVFHGMVDIESSYWVFDGATGGGAANGWNRDFGFKVVEPNDANALLRVSYSATANSVTIRHVELEGKGSASDQGGSYSNDGLAAYGAKDLTLSYFWMHGIGRGPFFLCAENAVIEHGWVQSFYGSSAVHSEVASIWSFDGPVGDTTFRYNLFTDIQSTGGLMWDNSENPSARMNVHGNVFYKPAGADWSVANGLIGGWTGGHGEECRNVSVFDNTFVNVDQESLSTLPNVASGNSAYDNLFYNCDSPNFSKFPDHDSNHFIGSGDADGEPHGTVGSGDPFVDMVGLDFRLKSATPAGTPQPAPFTSDPLGAARGADGTWDRGAFEFVEP